MATRVKTRANAAKSAAARFDIVLEVYSDARCSIVVGRTLADAWATARAAWPSLDMSHSPGDEACVVEVDDQCVMLLAADATVSTFVHEAVHVAAWILRSRGMPFTRKNEEGVAYLVEWVVQHGWPPVVAWAAQAPLGYTAGDVLAEQPVQPPDL